MSRFAGIKNTVGVNPQHHEELANFHFWREVGIRMKIEDIPESMEEYERFNIEHERKHFRYDDANRAIGDATVNLFVNWYPAIVRPLVREVIYIFHG